jgi:hypothetical protein
MDYASSAYIATAYDKPFNAKYDLLPPSEEAPPIDKVKEDLPDEKTYEEQYTDEGGYTEEEEQKDDNWMYEEPTPPLQEDSETGLYEEQSNEGDEYAYDDYYEEQGYDYSYDGDTDDSKSSPAPSPTPDDTAPPTDDDAPPPDDPTVDEQQNNQEMVNANTNTQMGDRDHDGIPDMVDGHPDDASQS